MKNLYFAFVIGLLTSNLALAKTEFAEDGNRVTKAGLLTLSASWVKDKGDKYDLGLKIKNENANDIIVNTQDTQCWRGNVSGTVSASDDIVALRPGQLKEIRYTCKLSQDAKGAYKVTVTRVFANPGSDGKTTGKVIGKDVAWQVELAGH